jgi:hypothetical protein
MIKVNEPYSHYPVAINDNERFERHATYSIDFKIDSDGKKTIYVNKRELKPYEWEYKEGPYYITLKDWA